MQFIRARIKIFNLNYRYFFSILVCYISFTNCLKSQTYISADPYYLFNYELGQFNGQLNYHSTAMRPFYNNNSKKLMVRYTNEFYYNNNASNQENMDLRYIGKGFGAFTSLMISGYSKYFAFNIEPYSLNDNYKSFNIYQRPNPYTYLNDTKTEIKNGVGLRKADIYLHYNGLGFGIAKENM